MKLIRIFCTITAYLQVILILPPILLDNRCVNGLITLRNNGYEGLVIAISDQVEEKTYPDLIAQLKTTFTLASSYLYTATKKRAYFRNITILIPENWAANASYEPATTESFYSSDIRIDYYPGDRTAIRARTIGLTTCGGLGQYILIAPQRLYKLAWSPARMVIHEWGHFRFGLYDEYAYTADEVFYRDETGDMIATKCSDRLPGLILKKNTYEPCSFPYGRDCVFFPQNPSAASGSIMFNQNIPAVIHFCDSNGDNPATSHNKLPNNRHNRLCESRSAWDIIKLGIDFANNINPPAEINDTTPYFKIVRPQKRRTILVLDTSGSMVGKPIQTLQQAATNYLLNVVQNGTQVGIIEFETQATKKSNLSEIKSNVERKRLVDRLPNIAGGATSIGAGLQLAVKMLKESVGNISPSGGTLIVLSDGKENTAPLIKDVKKEVLDNKITVQGISFGKDASKNLESLAYESGGLSFFAANNDTATLTNAFTAIAEKDTLPTDDTVVQLYSKQISLSSGENFTHTISLDNKLSVGLDFTFMWDNGNAKYIIIAPDNTEYNSSSSSFSTNSNRKLSQFAFDSDSIQIGNWRLRVSLPKSISQAETVVVTITSKSTPASSVDPLKQPLTISVGVSTTSIVFPNPAFMTVNVQKGYLAVLNTSVILTVTTPKFKTIILNANDQGAGADRIENDGIYSTYFTQFDDNGRYSMQAEVKAALNISFVNFNYVIGVGNLQSGDQFVVNGSESLGVESNVTNTKNFYLEEFSRILAGNLIEVTNYTIGLDGIPPARVHSLAVVSIDRQNFTMSLSFPAPGDDMDFGRASHYEIRYSLNRTNFVNDFTTGMLINDTQLANNVSLAKPSIAGSTETFVINMGINSSTQASYIFALQAFDESGLASSVSNYAEGRFALPAIPATTRATPATTASTTNADVATTAFDTFTETAATATTITSTSSSRTFMTTNGTNFNVTITAGPSGLSGGATAAIIVIVLLAVCLTSFLIVRYIRKRNNNQRAKEGENVLNTAYNEKGDISLSNINE